MDIEPQETTYPSASAAATFLPTRGTSPFLRDPVDRVLSHYHFHAQAGEPPGSRGPNKLREKWEGLLNNERTELDGPRR